jgi:hypothetical protein
MDYSVGFIVPGIAAGGESEGRGGKGDWRRVRGEEKG